MRKHPNGKHVFELKRSLGRWSFLLDESPRLASKQRSALIALADSGEKSVLDRVVSHELSLDDIVRALAPGGAGIDSLKPKFASVTLAQALDALKVELSGSPRNTQRIGAVISRQLLARFGSGRALASLDFLEIQRWLKRKNWSVSTQQQKRSYGARIWSLGIQIEADAARREGARPELVTNPWEFISFPRERARETKWLTLSQTHQMLDVLESRGRVRDAAFLACGFLGGMRIGEVSTLRWVDIDFSLETVAIVAYKDRVLKTKRSARLVHAPARLLALLAAWRQEARDLFVFGGTRSQPERTGDRWARKALDLAGHPDLTFHSGRHSAITNALDAGITIPEAVAQFGVSAKTLLTTYAHVIEEKRERIKGVFDDTRIGVA